MTITSIYPLFAMVALFVVTASLLSKVPPYRDFLAGLTAKPSFNLELEGLRGLLAISVVIHHAVVWYLLLYYGSPEIPGPNGNMYSQLGGAAVTVFFFITGFLFWSRLIVKPQPDFMNFMASRLRRLGPAYLGAVAFLLILVAALTHFRLLTTPATLVHNLLEILWGDTPLLNNLAYTPWLWGVTWTLRFECLFYLIIPFLGWFAGTPRKSALFVAGCGVLYGVNRAARMAHIAPPSVYEGFVRHLFFTFSIGIATAHLVRIPRLKQFCRSTWAASLALLLLLANFYLVPARYGLPESLSLAFPFLAVAAGCSFWGALRTRPVLFMGQISYSVYLLHPLILGAILIPLYRTLGSLMQSPLVYWTIFLCMAPLILAVAALWHRTFELPYLQRKAAPSSSEEHEGRAGDVGPDQGREVRSGYGRGGRRSSHQY